MRPARLDGMTAKSVRKKMKQASFAAAVSRDDIVRGAADLGVDLDEHITFLIGALAAIALSWIWCLKRVRQVVNRRLKVMLAVGGMHGGGTERQLVQILRHLDRDRFLPQLYLVYRTGPLLAEIPADVPVHVCEERMGRVRGYFPGRLHRLRVSDYANCLRETGTEVSYDRTFLMTLITAAGAQRVGVPNVSTIVTNPETGFAPVAGRFQWLKRRMLHRLYNRSTQVLAVSEGARQSAIRFYGIDPARIRTQYNGIDVQAVRQAGAGDPGMSGGRAAVGSRVAGWCDWYLLVG